MATKRPKYLYFLVRKKNLIGQSTNIFSVKTGFKELKKKVNKLDSWYLGLLVAVYQKPKYKNMRWTGQLLPTWPHPLRIQNNPPTCPQTPSLLNMKQIPKKNLQWSILFKNTTIQNFLEVLYFTQDLKTDILNNFTIWLCSMQLHNCVIFKHL